MSIRQIELYLKFQFLRPPAERIAIADPCVALSVVMSWWLRNGLVSCSLLLFASFLCFLFAFALSWFGYFIVIVSDPPALLLCPLTDLRWMILSHSAFSLRSTIANLRFLFSRFSSCSYLYTFDLSTAPFR